MERRRKAALGRNEVDVALEPAIERVTGLVFGGEDRRRVCAGVDFSTEDRGDEVRALRKVAVDGADADAGLLGDLSDRSVHPRGREHRHGRLEQRIDVALGVGAQAPIRAAARLQTIPCSSASSRTTSRLLNGTLFRINRTTVPFRLYNAARRRWPHSNARLEMAMQDKPVALVTGANQGIGLQIAKDLAAQGFTVLVGSRNLERGEAAAKEVGPDAHALQLDVTDQASIAAAAERIRKEFGRLDVLVNNAAISNTRHAAGHVRRGVFQVDPPEQRVPR